MNTEIELEDFKNKADVYYQQLTKAAPQKGLGSHEHIYFTYGIEWAFNRLQSPMTKAVVNEKPHPLKDNDFLNELERIINIKLPSYTVEKQVLELVDKFKQQPIKEVTVTNENMDWSKIESAFRNYRYSLDGIETISSYTFWLERNIHNYLPKANTVNEELKKEVELYKGQVANFAESVGIYRTEIKNLKAVNEYLLSALKLSEELLLSNGIESKDVNACGIMSTITQAIQKAEQLKQ